MEPAEVSEELVGGRAQAEAGTSLQRVAEGLLEGAEKVACARNRQRHGPQFPQKLVPGFGRDTAPVRRNGVEEFKHAGGPVCREVYGALFGVQDPAEDGFAGVPGTITFEEFLGGDGFLTGWTVRVVEWPK
jgi:hypothetical protein